MRDEAGSFSPPRRRRQSRRQSLRQSRPRPEIIELGSGTGFLAVLLAQLGADMLATDLDSEHEMRDEPGDLGAVGGDDAVRQAPLGRLKGNAALNETEGRGTLTVRALDWFDALSVQGEKERVGVDLWSGLRVGDDSAGGTGAGKSAEVGDGRLAELPCRTVIAADVVS